MVEGSATALPFDNDTFDVTCSFKVLAHVPGEVGLGVARRRLAPRHHLTMYHEKAEKMGRPLDAAMLIGQYRLVRGARVTEGVNTRLFRKTGGKWLITVNHVSAYDVAPTSTAPEAR
mgnify:CR=1 FL=1